MIFWTIVVFITGLLGLVHEAWLINYKLPFFAEATSVSIMLIALGMLYSQLRSQTKKKK